MLINGREKGGINTLKNPKSFIDYSQTIHDGYENLEDYNPIKKRRVLIPKVTILFLRERKRNISLVFISQSYFKVLKTIWPNATHYFITKIPNKRELQRIALSHLSDTDFKDFMKFYRNYDKEPYLFLVNDTTLLSYNPLQFRKNLL